MFQKKEEQVLNQLNLKELEAHRKDAMVRKAELLQQKKDSALTQEEQVELEDLALYLVALDKRCETAKAEAEAAKAAKAAKAEAEAAKAAKAEAETKKGKAQRVAILKISRGRRFDPNTGKRWAPVFKQTFTASEYRQFMANYKSLGYTIEEEVVNPFKEI